MGQPGVLQDPSLGNLQGMGNMHQQQHGDSVMQHVGPPMNHMGQGVQEGSMGGTLLMPHSNPQLVGVPPTNPGEYRHKSRRKASEKPKVQAESCLSMCGALKSSKAFGWDGGVP
jgi:hypothetical protein